MDIGMDMDIEGFQERGRGLKDIDIDDSNSPRGWNEDIEGEEEGDEEEDRHSQPSLQLRYQVETSR